MSRFLRECLPFGRPELGADEVPTRYHADEELKSVTTSSASPPSTAPPTCASECQSVRKQDYGRHGTERGRSAGAQRLESRFQHHSPTGSLTFHVHLRTG